MSYVSFEWAGEPNASESIKRVDGVEVARNRLIQPILSDRTGAWFSSSQVLMESVPGTGVLVIANADADVQSSTQIITLDAQHAVTRSDGDITYSFFKVTNPAEAPRPIQLRPRIATYYSDDTRTQWGSGENVWIDPGETVELFYESTALPNVINSRVAIVPGTSQNFIEGDSVLIHDGWTVQTNADSVEMFHGDTTNYFTGTTYEWAGEPHASESIKRVDGVEVERTTQHLRTIRLDESNTSHSFVFDVAPGTTKISWRAEFRSTENRPGRDAAGGLMNFRGLETVHGRGNSFPSDGEWHLEDGMPAYAPLPDGDQVEFLFRQGTTTSPWYEVRNLQVRFNDDDPWPELWDGDTTNDYTPPTFHVRQDGEWRPALPRVFTGGAYHHVPMKQYSDGGYE